MSKYIGAVGIAVSELETSVAFYTNIVGMVELQTFELPAVTQVVLGFEGVRGASVLLMKHKDDTNRNFENSPVKLVFYIPDTAATLEAVRDAGFVVEREAIEVPSMGNAIVGFAKDPDGYLVEFFQKPPKK
ncbi:MAG: VOC family protein [Woeseiaceae bacterium]